MTPPSQSDDRAKRPRLSVVRKMTSSMSDDKVSVVEEMQERTEGMAARAKEMSPFTDDEALGIINSLQNITPKNANIDWDSLSQFLKEKAHLSHKDWTRTGDNSETMAKILTPNGMTDAAKQMFERILDEGNWDGAEKHTKETNHGGGKPWAVLVTGVNGIRKTTSMYQDWFPKLLSEALVAPSSDDQEEKAFPVELLPTGENSFFRQLDHMITTLTNEDFSKLYELTGAQMNENEQAPPSELIQKYSNLKAAIFSRYRTLSELLGALLLREAQKVNINAMCETSGRDVAMFHYIDHFFPKGYNKLALHFTINELDHAKKSVDDRMINEMKTGHKALHTGDVVDIIYANTGGPYGSEVLPGIQEDSDRVWKDDVLSGKTGKDWYKATIAINAHSSKPWTAQAVRPDGSLGTEFIFAPPK